MKKLLVLLLIASSFTSLSQYSVDFEAAGETKTAYASGTVTLSGVNWDMTEALIGTSATDFFNGTRSARLRGYGTSSMTMLEDLSGAGTISFQYRQYGTDTQNPWSVEYSTNGGGSWTQIGSNFTADGTVRSFSATVNNCSSLRFRIICAGTGSTNRRTNIDDIAVTACGPSNTITTGTNPGGAPFTVSCSGDDSGTISFTSTGTFVGGNNFTAELSDASGSFTDATTIGSNAISGINPSGTINFTIPSGTLSGSTYKIRVVADSPNTLGTESTTFLITLTNGPCIVTPALPSQGLMINEFSNGASGSQEYYEFVVVGQCGESVDIQGYMIDDNNGTFGTGSGMGIASGHLKLKNHSQWASIPVGSLVVVYNADDKNGSLPADDPFDANNDSLYVIPHNNSTLFDLSTDLPSVSDSTYSSATYGSTSWAGMGIANSGDAVQVRTPDGSFWYGVSYGGLTGGPYAMNITSGSMSGSCGWFTDGDIFDVSNWSVGSASSDETPGLPNNGANLSWLRMMRDPMSVVCPIVILPSEILDFSAQKVNSTIELKWNITSEGNVEKYEVFGSNDGFNFQHIGEVDAENRTSFTTYSLVHSNPSPGKNYYRLYTHDNDGTISSKKFTVINFDYELIHYNSKEKRIYVGGESDIEVYAVDGRLINQYFNTTSFSIEKAGIYIVRDVKRNYVKKIYCY